MTTAQAPQIRKGLTGVIVDTTAISKVVPETNSLTYRGYAVQDLAANCSFEQVAWLLWPALALLLPACDPPDAPDTSMCAKISTAKSGCRVSCSMSSSWIADTCSSSVRRASAAWRSTFFIRSGGFSIR